MRSFKFLASSVLAAALCLSCSRGARLTVDLDAPAGSSLTVRMLDMNVYKALDTLRTNRSGRASCVIPVSKGKPEFIYLFYGQRRIVSLLLEKGDRVHVKADTLGSYTVDGSAQCDTLRAAEMSYADFITRFAAAGDSKELGALYVAHYRESVRRVMANSHSLVVIPVLYERISDYTPMFNRPADAVIFRSAADSLMAVYPESPYVQALAKEASRRVAEMKMGLRLSGAPVIDYPDLVMPDVQGEIRRLSEVQAKAILVHFWSASSVSDKLFNKDVLLPLYEEFHSRGLEIYSVCVDADKVLWGSVVRSQKLPWINVNDGRGAASSAVTLYNVTGLPATFLLSGGKIRRDGISGESGLRRELAAILY